MLGQTGTCSARADAGGKRWQNQVYKDPWKVHLRHGAWGVGTFTHEKGASGLSSDRSPLGQLWRNGMLLEVLRNGVGAEWEGKKGTGPIPTQHSQCSSYQRAQMCSVDSWWETPAPFLCPPEWEDVDSRFPSERSVSLLEPHLALPWSTLHGKPRGYSQAHSPVPGEPFALVRLKPAVLLTEQISTTWAHFTQPGCSDGHQTHHWGDRYEWP